MIALDLSGALGLSAKGIQADAIERGSCTRIPAADAGRLACSPDGQAALDRAGSRADVATALAVGGGLLVSTASVLSALALAPEVSATSVGLQLSARFWSTRVAVAPPTSALTSISPGSSSGV